ncbi:hypothetical protein L4X63_23035 [Geomonas sp. Red32]|uniref:hypothetical protein n=1 Tax=Geomonas sp. Red32 TaxID=2912856 RepID=UPI00202D0828|nr:hypothetical protein [Geomonas sp. Red32]MCM0084457.1 hypothetical protein [Geomonas sp. Red32]
MDPVEELSYYEYWLTKDVWRGDLAVDIVIGAYLLNRSWTADDDMHQEATNLRDGIIKKLGYEDAKAVFLKRSERPSGYDHNGDYQEAKIVLQNSDFHPKKFLAWLYDKGYDLPYEFKAEIEKEDAELPMRQRLRGSIDKEVCQGIARTLWDSSPDMTIEQMRDHKAIQVYGSGKLYKGDNTLRGWLREVDPRTHKTGPKKKL